MTIQRFYIYDQTNEKSCTPCKCYLELARNTTFHFASFRTLEQAEKFFKKFKIKLELQGNYFGGLSIFKCNKIFDDRYFWKLEDLPQNAKKIKALSNGSIVDCYYTTNRKEVIFWRPNPNAKDIYKPLSLEKHIEHEKIHGIY